MKYPKLFDGTSPVGESNIRALENTSAPYLTIQGGNSTAHKRGLFREVNVAKQLFTPFVSTEFETPGHLLFPLIANPFAGIKVEPAEIPPLGAGGYFCSPYRAFVGDDYIVSYQRDIPDQSALSGYYWFTMRLATKPTPIYDTGDPLGEGASIDLYNSIPDITGEGQWAHGMSMFGLGWRNETERYVFAVSYLALGAARPAGPTETISREPRVAIGTTAGLALTPVSPPYVHGHFYNNFTPIATGRGEIQYLQLPQESYDYITDPGLHTFLPVEQPSIVWSHDYGSSWSEVEATFLIQYLNWFPNYVGMDRRYYSFGHLKSLGRYSAMYNIGDDKVFLVISHGMRALPVDEADPNWGYWAGNADFNPMLFIADKASAAFTRVPWPPDDWCVTDWGLPRPPLLVFGGPREPWADTYQLGLRRMGDLRQAHFVYGTGCFYMPIIPFLEANYLGSTTPRTGWQIMFTTDFGATWRYGSADVPETIQNVGSGSPAGTVLTPYISDEKPGKLLFEGTSTTDELEMWIVDGLFSTWKRAIKKSGVTTVDTTNDNYLFQDPGSYAVNYGNGQDMKRSIYPAFPGEFEA